MQNNFNYQLLMTMAKQMFFIACREKHLTFQTSRLAIPGQNEDYCKESGE
jgi:hypothetical protein